jgi:hypothetical protein
MNWRRVIPSGEALLTNRWLRWLAPWLRHPGLWCWSRRGVALGVALGAFFAPGGETPRPDIGRKGARTLAAGPQRRPMLSRVTAVIALAASLAASGLPARADPWSAPFTVQFGAFRADASTAARVDSRSGDLGTRLDLERHLGVSDRETLLRVELLLRLAPRHGIEASWVSLERAGTLRIAEEIRFRDATYSIDESIDTTFDSEEARFAYRYSFVHDERKELALLLGASHATLRTSIAPSVGGISESASVRGWLPAVGLRASARFAGRWRVHGFAQGLDARIGDYDARLAHAGAGIEWAFAPSAYAGLGFHHYRYRIETTRRDVRGIFRHSFEGPAAYLGWTF